MGKVLHEVLEGMGYYVDSTISLDVPDPIKGVESIAFRVKEIAARAATGSIKRFMVMPGILVPEALSEGQRRQAFEEEVRRDFYVVYVKL